MRGEPFYKKGLGYLGRHIHLNRHSFRKGKLKPWAIQQWDWRDFTRRQGSIIKPVELRDDYIPPVKKIVSRRTP